MKRNITLLFFIGILLLCFRLISCTPGDNNQSAHIGPGPKYTDSMFRLDTAKIPAGKYGEAIRYGLDLMNRTAYWIGPDGKSGQFLGNKMNCTNCHQEAGTKPFSFNLIHTFQNYPQYRAREGKVLSLAERVNNCIMHPHIGKPLPLNSKEMIAFLSYFKWLNDSLEIPKNSPGLQNVSLEFPSEAASSKNGEKLYQAHCSRCHGKEGDGILQANDETYIYPPLWGSKAYQPGSSMHRVIKLAQWIYTNMPYQIASHEKPFLTSGEAFDLAAFINDDSIHLRPKVTDFEYPDFKEKAIDYDRGPFNDTFPEFQHKYGPYQPILDYYKSKGQKASY